MGSNPGAICWMDMTFFILICCDNFIACLKRPKINEKEAGLAQLKNIQSYFTRGGAQHGILPASFKVFLSYIEFPQKDWTIFAMIKYLGTKKGC